MSNRLDLDLMRGAIDMHVHAHPDVVPRIGDEIDIANTAKSYGMGAVLFKSALVPNYDRVQYVNKIVPELKSFGGVVLNPPVGGLNPSAVETTIKLGGKAVWMPTIFSEAHMSYLKSEQVSFGYRLLTKQSGQLKGLTILDKEKNLLPEVEEILGKIADANILLCTGHLSKTEIFILLERAKKAGVKKILVTHPSNVVPNLTLEEQTRLVQSGAYMEHCFVVTMPMWRTCSPLDILNMVNKLGPEHCVLATDFGQVHHPSPPEGLRMFIRTLSELGASFEDLQIMTKNNPSKLLDIETK